VFFTEFNDILGGFRQRAEETFGLLRQPQVGFVLVASPSRWRCARRCSFHERLTGAGCRSSGSSSTRCTRRGRSRPGCPSSRQRSPRTRASRRSGSRGRRTGWRRRRSRPRTPSSRRSRWPIAQAIGRLRAAGRERGLLVEVPLLRDDVHDVDRLVGLERYLFRGTEGAEERAGG
jgi:hypothetical protein